MIQVALKEWAIVCDLLLEGRFALLLRKGGIHERSGPGVFELDHPRFALFPSWAHQQPQRIKAPFRAGAEPCGEPDELTIHGIAEAVSIQPVPSRAALDALDDLHGWTAEQIDMRFNYRPENPLFLMAVRCRRLVTPKTIPNRPDYAGCVSWVPLGAEDVVDEAGAEPVMSDDAFAEIVRRVDAAFAG